ncbi:MAG: PAS domain-containing protein [Marinobacter sp.]
MDSDLSDIAPSGHHATLWPGLWAPALILLVGVVISLVTARQASDTTQHLAQQRYQAMHQALVRQVIIYLQNPSTPSGGVPALEVALAEGLHDDMGLRIDTLERHTKTPVLQLGNTRHLAGHHTLRTELETDDQHWMVTTIPGDLLLALPARQTSWLVVAGGLTITALATLAALVLCRQNHRNRRTIGQLMRSQLASNQQVTNLQVEKNVLRHALNDSESRSRDLVALSGAIIAELDEHGRIGFLSAQAADLLGHAPSELVDQPFSELVPEPDRLRFSQGLEAARRDQTMARIDLNLLHRNTELTVPMVVRIMALHNPLHGVTGYRLSAVSDSSNRV